MNALPYDALALPPCQAAFVIDATPLLAGIALVLAFGAAIIVHGAWSTRRRRAGRREDPGLLLRRRSYAPRPLGYGESR